MLSLETTWFGFKTSPWSSQHCRTLLSATPSCLDPENPSWTALMHTMLSESHRKVESQRGFLGAGSVNLGYLLRDATEGSNKACSKACISNTLMCL